MNVIVERCVNGEANTNSKNGSRPILCFCITVITKLQRNTNEKLCLVNQPSQINSIVGKEGPGYDPFGGCYKGIDVSCREWNVGTSCIYFQTILVL